jgi:hypothetical protein
MSDSLHQNMLSYLNDTDNIRLALSSKQMRKHMLLHYFSFKDYVQSYKDASPNSVNAFPIIIHEGIEYTLQPEAIKQILVANDVDVMSMFKVLELNRDQHFIDDVYASMLNVGSDEMWLVLYLLLSNGTSATDKLFINHAVRSVRNPSLKKTCAGIQSLRVLFPGNASPGRYMSLMKCFETMLIAYDSNNNETYQFQGVRENIVLLALKTIELCYFEQAFGNTNGYGDETNLCNELIACRQLPESVKAYLVDFKNGKIITLDELLALRATLPR